MKYLWLVLMILPMTSCCHRMDTPCRLGAPRWIKPTRAEATAHMVPEKDRARFQLVAEHSKHTGNPDRLIGMIQEGDVLAFRMTKQQKKDGLLSGSVRTFGYVIMKYAHLAIAVRDSNGELRLYTSQALRGPNLLDELGELKKHSFDIYRLDKIDRLDMRRLREFAAISAQKTNKWYGYNFLGMLGLWSNQLEPQSPSDIGDDYICSTSVAAALHYAGLDLDRVRCCEMLNLISPWRVVKSAGRIYQPGKCACCKP